MWAVVYLAQGICEVFIVLQTCISWILHEKVAYTCFLHWVEKAPGWGIRHEIAREEQVGFRIMIVC